MSQQPILQFPRAQEVRTNATRWDIWRDTFRMALCRLANYLGVPGAIANITIDDAVTGQHIEVQTGILFTRVSVNGRDYYFRRFSGEWDGTGMGCAALR